jgi:hypothetical protein
MGDPTQLEVWKQLDHVLAAAWSTVGEKELEDHADGDRLWRPLHA